jgi:pyruvate/2-oxoglutarate dehydrogenase complex dihydrolipoamide acyltransferase (E2) component
MMATTFHRVRSSHPEDDALGRTFGPGELVPNLDVDDPFNQRKIDEGIFYPVNGEEAREAEEAEAEAEAQKDGPEVTPAAARLASDNDVDLSEVTGTGKDGSIKVEDVQKALDDREQEGEEEEGDD